ncbi:trypsin-like peptidase domain-containing protein [Streptomyces sp. MB09-01]|uniref:nSTAND1 domain-containing NTPase n=1 Tax=Streptomyces sp. MB09-01 TaxID=3028666 RepID=UPI0029A657EF|nr:trypsin-like peptidase domain-containing protein [Streptomyces sp. MB09-01]MDX3538831.1 trypsin-like peptidase domain-containing protein [Streptomyces sp. MB09-01]
MAGDATSGLPPAVAQILGPEGEVAGAGFLVAEGLLVTCAHVVRGAGSGPGGSVRLAFPHAAGAPQVEGQVLDGPWRAPEGEDVAIIRLSDAPAGIAPLPLGSASGCRGHEVRSFGFPAQAPPDGHFGFGVAGDLLPTATSRGTHLQLTAANDLTTGFSGGPVLDEVTGLVIGMLTEITAPDEHERGQGIAYVTPTQVLREIWPDLAEQNVCPYRGLETFTAEHARWFQGRQEAVRQVVANLAQQCRLTLLLGPSGSGKSSLIQAGVLRVLTEGELPGSDRWLVMLARPRQDLPAELERAGLDGAATDGIAAAVTRRLTAEPTHQRLVLIIDQFEELFTQSATGLAVADQIATAVTSNAELHIVLVMRDDFYPQLAALAPRLLEAAMPGLLNVPGNLSRQDLCDIITLPAQDVGLHFQAGLPEQIISDVLAAAPKGAATRQAPVTVLPLLELTLSQLWQRRHDGYLTHQAYQRVGGVTGSLTTWCDTALNQLPASQRPIAQRILSSLVRPADPSHGIPATRAQIPLDELRELAANPDGPGSDAGADEVIAALTHHRIITTQTLRNPEHPNASSGPPVAELIHDALIRDWGTLRNWVSQDHRFQVWLDRARVQSARFHTDHDPGDLLGGTALAEGLEWAQQRRLPRDIMAFLTASKQRQQAAARRSRRLNTVLATLLALALVATGIAVWQWQTADARQQAARSRQLANQSSTLLGSNRELASLLAIQAFRTSETDEAAASLQTVAALPGYQRFLGHTAAVKAVAFSPDGKTLATGSYDGTARLWEMPTGSHPKALKGHTDVATSVTSVAFSPDGKTLATGISNGSILLWNVTSGTLAKELKGHTDVVNSVTFSPDGKILASGSNDTTIRVWNMPSRTYLYSLTGHTDVVNSVTFSPDGKILASGSNDTTIRVWNMPSRTCLYSLTGETGSVHSVAFDPDGKILASGTADSLIVLWNMPSGTYRKVLKTDSDEVVSVAFSPDGKSLASGNTEHTALLWDVETGAIRMTLLGHNDWVFAVAFSSDRKTLATGSRDQTFRLWDVSTKATHSMLTGHTNSVNSVAFSPDGKTVATGSFDKTVRLWNADSGNLIKALKGHTEDLAAVAFSPDGHTLASGGVDGEVRLWDIPTRSLRKTLPELTSVYSLAFSRPDGNTLAIGTKSARVFLWDIQDMSAKEFRRKPLEGHSDIVYSVAFSPDGRTLASGSADGNVRLWDMPSGTRRDLKKEHTNQVHSVAFSPDGRTLATGSIDRTVKLWKMATGELQKTFIGHTDMVHSVAFSPDGRTLASSSYDGTARLWNLTTGAPRVTLIGHSGAVRAVAFHPKLDKQILATGSNDQTARLWDVGPLNPKEAIKKVCQTVNRDLSQSERTAYLPGQSVDHVCPAR